jgi:hypothetical protein
MGSSDHIGNVITVHDRAAPSRTVEILLHEAIHAMLTGHDYDQEEHIIVHLGESLASFLQDNPEFIRKAVDVLTRQS